MTFSLKWSKKMSLYFLYVVHIYNLCLHTEYLKNPIARFFSKALCRPKYTVINEKNAIMWTERSIFITQIPKRVNLTCRISGGRILLLIASI